MATLTITGTDRVVLDVVTIVIAAVLVVTTITRAARALRRRGPRNLERYKQGWVDAGKGHPPFARDRHYMKGYMAERDAELAEIAEQERKLR